MATAGLYRRVLPSPPAIEFASPEGKQLFAEAYQNGKMEGFFKLISYFQTQSEPAYCGLASLAMVLNALGIDPGRKWKGPWRWFDESMLDCCEPLEKIKDKGIRFEKVACLALCNGADVQAFRTNQSTIDGFRQYVITCTSSEDCHLITSYNRRLLKQTGSGHFSPIGGYHAGRDMVLILDVARFKYPPHWVPLSLLWEAMNTIDEVTKLRRGFMIITRPDKAPSLLYTLSCKVDSWVSIAKYLVEDVSIILKSEDVKDVQTVLSLVFTSQPTNFGEFIKWVVEVRREEDGGSSLSKEEKGRVAMKEEVLKEVKETELFKHVTEWLSSATSCCPSFTDGHSAVPVVSGTAVKYCSEHMIDMLVPKSKTSCCGSSSVNCFGKHPGSSDILTASLLALPPHAWSGIKDDKLLQEIHGLVSTDSLPPLLQEEILHLRRQLLVLTKCLDDHLGVERKLWIPSLTTTISFKLLQIHTSTFCCNRVAQKCRLFLQRDCKCKNTWATIQDSHIFWKNPSPIQMWKEYEDDVAQDFLHILKVNVDS